MVLMRYVRVLICLQTHDEDENRHELTAHGKALTLRHISTRQYRAHIFAGLCRGTPSRIWVSLTDSPSLSVQDCKKQLYQYVKDESLAQKYLKQEQYPTSTVRPTKTVAIDRLERRSDPLLFHSKCNSYLHLAYPLFACARHSGSRPS